ncbi:MAG: hypothetical protein RBS32_08960 [Aliarcobacter sp.]|jgi:DNA polymerase-3 subunit gamma/tau|nr:hypothetical protein [Aliarcobacter sp.]
MLGLIEQKLMDDIFSIILNKGDINQIVKDLESYDVSQICDEIAIYLKDKMLTKDRNFDLLLFDRFFRILSDAKHLLAINSDGGFVLILTFLKMIEATNIRTIDDIINQVQKIEPKKETIISKPLELMVEKPIEKIIQEPKPVHIIEQKVEVEIVKPIEIEVKQEVMKTAIFIKEEPKVEELSPFDEPMIDEVKIESSSLNTMDLNIIEGIEVVDYSTPFDDFPQDIEPIKIVETIAIKEEPNIEPIVLNEIKEIEIEPIISENQSYVNVNQEIEIIPFEEEEDEIQLPKEIKELEAKNEQYQELTSKVYDRDYSLGECFEKNFIFNGFENKKLYILSKAQDEDRKLLYKYFGIIKTFAQDVFGNDVELDFKKEEPSQVNNQDEPKNEVSKIEIPQDTSNANNDDLDEESGSMLESIEMGSGCVADMTKSSIVTPAQKELQLNDILNSKMLDKTKELFDIKKITVKSRS